MRSEREIWPDELVKKTHWIARAYGVAQIGFGILAVTAEVESKVVGTLFDAVGTFYVAVGSGDLITGKHHYASIKTACLISGIVNNIRNKK